MKHLKNNNLDKYFSYKTSMELILHSKFAKIAFSLSIKTEYLFSPILWYLSGQNQKCLVMSIQHDFYILFPFKLWPFNDDSCRKVHGPFIL